MSNRGTFKFICEDCGGYTYLTPKDRSSRFRPHCISCGSVFLSPSKGSKAKEVQKEVATAKNNDIRLFRK